jgi:uncharacterized membrane protein YeaQ/YmgE (transglycosylase-associated protein family)
MPANVTWQRSLIPGINSSARRSSVDRPQEAMFNMMEGIMSFLAWIILGLISGFIASKIVNKSGEGVVVDILLGIVGAFVGGWLFNTFGMAGVSGVNIYSMVVAVVGAIVVLVIYHALSGRRV